MKKKLSNRTMQLTQYLDNTFLNYFLTLAVCHEQEKNPAFRASSSELLVDCFALIPNLKTWVLCWSNTGSAPVNRVFIASANPDFIKASSKSKKTVFSEIQKSAQSSPETDLALSLHRQDGSEIAALIPLYSAEGETFGIVRAIGSRERLKQAGIIKGSSGIILNQRPNCTLPDPDLIPHVLGRWAGNNFGQDDTAFRISALLTSFASFFKKSHDMYYRRDFDADEVVFVKSTNPKTNSKLKDLKAPINSHDYMFTIVAERGASEIVDEFPEDLVRELRINASEWNPNSLYKWMLAEIKSKSASYIGIPLKVDDSVIGVVALLVPREEPLFNDAARFIRSTLSEMGRTIDKTAISRTSVIIRNFASKKLAASEDKMHLPTLGRELVEALVKELLPFGTARVGFQEVRLGAPEDTNEVTIPQITAFVNKRLLDAMTSERISIHVLDSVDATRPRQGLILVPFPAALPFVLYVTGPLSLLTGRSFRAALEQLQSVLLVSLAASEQMSSRFDISKALFQIRSCA